MRMRQSGLKFANPLLQVAYYKVFLKKTRHYMGDALKSDSLARGQPANKRGVVAIVVGVRGLCLLSITF